MPDQILAVGPSGRKRMIPPHWLGLELGFRPFTSKRNRKRSARPAPPTETQSAAESTAEPEPKE